MEITIRNPGDMALIGSRVLWVPIRLRSHHPSHGRPPGAPCGWEMPRAGRALPARSSPGVALGAACCRKSSQLLPVQRRWLLLTPAPCTLPDLESNYTLPRCDSPHWPAPTPPVLTATMRVSHKGPGGTRLNRGPARLCTPILGTGTGGNQSSLRYPGSCGRVYPPPRGSSARRRE